MTAALMSSRRPLDPASFAIRRCLGTEAPAELKDLRRAVWADEKGLLPEAQIFDENDRQGVHFLLYDTSDVDRLAAATCAVEAERSEFAGHSRFPADVLRDTIVSTRSTVHPDYRGNSLLALLIYLGAREGRMLGRRWIMSYLERGTGPAWRIVQAVELDRVPPRRVCGRDGAEYEVVATAGDLNQIMLDCFRHMPSALVPHLRERLFVDEVVAEVMRGARRLYEGPWFCAIEEGRLSRRQYLTTLSEMHAYVRWTTRVLGSVIGITPDPELRRHYIAHLEGEVDHEIQLEHDIAHLAGDVARVKHHWSPSEPIRGFMALQESLCSGLRRDPCLFLAVPFAMEGLTAFVTGEFLENLAKNIASWGVNHPSRAMTFLASHTRSDGGADGHWESARRILHRHLAGEQELQEFLSIVRLIQDSVHRAFTSYATMTDIFAAIPEGP
jgi:hypothetical protein